MAPKPRRARGSATDGRKRFEVSAGWRLLFGFVVLAVLLGGATAALAAGPRAVSASVRARNDPSTPSVPLAAADGTRGPSDDPLGVVTQVPVGAAPGGVAYDSARHQVFVVNGNSNTVSVIADGTGVVVATIPVGASPVGAAYDAGTAEVFVANSGSDNVSVISTATNQVVAWVPLALGSAPVALAYDAGTSTVWVADYGTNDLSVIDDANYLLVGTIAVGTHPSGIAYDPPNAVLWVTNRGSDNIMAVSDTSGMVLGTVPVGAGPLGITYDSALARLYVGNVGASTVTVLRTTGATLGTVTIPGSPLALAYDERTGSIAVVYQDSSPLLFGHMDVIADVNNTIVASVGLTGGGSPDAIAYDTGNGGWYIAQANVNNVIIVAPGFYVTFSETGLPAGTPWQIWMNGTTPYGASNELTQSTTATLRFTKPNGTYAFTVRPITGFVATPVSGSVTVAGAPATQTIAFTFPYAVTFTETGLPAGTSWSITLAATTKSASTASIVFSEPNGTYAFTVGTVSGYDASPASGSVAVSGAAASEGVQFTATPSFGGLTTSPLLLVGLIVVVLLAVVGAVVFMLRRRKTSPPSPGVPPPMMGPPPTAPPMMASPPPTSPPMAPMPPLTATPQSPPTAPPTGLCPACGLQNEANAVFCNRCGTRLR